ncbi:MAG: TonB-dependent receptor plug domain-containing protein [Owenweeksia sp.]|nr:TonB-dependent receptor plug domain-containing protein [Owenweeksia sp.]
MSRLRLINLLLFIASGSGSTAQPNRQASGRVIDAQTMEPLANAAVVATDGYTITDTSGYFQLKTSATHIQISFIGYQTQGFKIIYKDTAQPRYALQPANNELQEVVISAGKFEQRLAEVPISLDVMKPQLLQDKNLVNLRTSLQQAPGVNVTDGQANIRAGSGWTYGAGTRVQTVVDGLPLISGDASQVQWDLVPIFSVERIEVLKGASSVLYGSAALNGVINVFTHFAPQ